jgi:hypothetical protein
MPVAFTPDRLHDPFESPLVRIVDELSFLSRHPA